MVSGWKLHPFKGDLKGLWSPYCQAELAVDFPQQ